MFVEVQSYCAHEMSGVLLLGERVARMRLAVPFSPSPVGVRPSIFVATQFRNSRGSGVQWKVRGILFCLSPRALCQVFCPSFREVAPRRFRCPAGHLPRNSAENPRSVTPQSRPQVPVDPGLSATCLHMGKWGHDPLSPRHAHPHPPDLRSVATPGRRPGTVPRPAVLDSACAVIDRKSVV